MKAKLVISEFGDNYAVLTIKTRDFYVLVLYTSAGPVAAAFDGKQRKFLLNDLSIAQRKLAEGFLSNWGGETQVVTRDFFDRLLQVQFSPPK